MKNIFFPFLLDAATEGGGGGGGNPNPNPTPDPNKPAPTEAEKERDRLVAENAEVRKKAKANEDALNAIKLEIAELKKAGNKTQGDWQKVAEQTETEKAELLSENTNLKAAFKNTLVSSRIREEALKQGAKADMVDLIDSMEFSEVEFNLDPASMKFNLKGVETAVGNLKKLRPSFFDTKAPPAFNKGGPSGGNPGAPKTVDEAKKHYLDAMRTRHKDPVKFNEAHLNYQKALTEAKKTSK